ncbi:MAG TPA: FUN14 domain-containing protein [Tepidisphaeraceae bacterium]|jgi:uncharacterized membrane protein (Fun14 family)
MAEAVDPRQRWRVNPPRLSGLQTKALLIALAVLVAGAGGWVWGWIDRPGDVPAAVATPEGARGIVDPVADGAQQQQAADDARAAQTWGQWLSGKGMRLGSGFLGGFLIGFATRTYVRTVASIAGIVTVLLGVASYFGFFNIDFSAVQQQWAGASEWLLTQADKAKDALWAHLPSSTAGFAGFFFGALRRR